MIVVHRTHSPNRACTDGVLTVLSWFLGSPQVSPPGLPRSCRGGCSLTQARPNSGQAWPRADFLEFGNLGTWKSRNLGSKKSKRKISKFKSVLPKMSARSGLVGTKILLAPFGPIPGNFFHGPEKSKILQKIAYFPWWANGLYSPGLGSCAGFI